MNTDDTRPDREPEDNDDMEAWAAAVVATLPPLTDAERERLALLLAPRY